MPSRFAVTVVSMLLGTICLYAGGLKLWRVEAFAAWNYPLSLMHALGVLECAAAILVVVPATRFYGACILAGLMLTAIFTHISNGQSGLLTAPVVLLLVGGIIVANGRKTPRSEGGSEFGQRATNA